MGCSAVPIKASAVPWEVLELGWPVRGIPHWEGAQATGTSSSSEVTLGKVTLLSFFKDNSQRGMPTEGCLQAAPTDTEEMSHSVLQRNLVGSTESTTTHF